MGYVHLADAGSKQGGGGKSAKGHSITGDAFLGKETLLGGIFSAVGSVTREAHRSQEAM